MSTTAAYLNEMIAHVESKGKKAGIWNPINGIGQDALDASLAQMWGTRGIVAPGKANIDCRYNYTNHFDVFADLVGIYKSTIYYKEKGDATVAGTISALPFMVTLHLSRLQRNVLRGSVLTLTAGPNPC